MIKKLASCIRQYKKQTILTPVFMTLEVIMEVIIPLLMAKLIDDGIDAGNMNEIIRIGIILVMLAVLSLTFGVLSGHFAAKASTGFAKNLRQDMYDNVQRFSFANIEKFSTASIITRLTTDITNIQMAFQMIIRIAVRCPLMLIFSLLMAFSINAKLSLVFLVIVPVLAIGFYLIIRNAHAIFERVFKTYDKLNNIVQENLRGIRVVKAYVREKHEEKKFKNTSYEIFKDFSKAEKLIALNAPLMQFAVYSCLILIAWFGARIIITTKGIELTTGELMGIITYAMQILISLMMLSIVFVMIIISRASAERTYEILKEEPTITNPKKPKYKVSDGSINFNKVSFCYGKNKECLTNINLKIKSGEMIGIIGETGSGKSSLLQLIPRLYDTTTGSILVGGTDVKEYDIKTLRDSVSMVLQKNTLFSGTIKENLKWGNENATDKEMLEACKISQAHEFINKFDKKYDTYVEQGGANLSGGQKQRLCIARALLKNPKILILDDSTSAVDTKTDMMIRDLLRKLLPKTTKIIVAQRISSIQDADKIIVMDDGKIQDIGTHEELLNKNDIYKEVYISQQKGGDNK